MVEITGDDLPRTLRQFNIRIKLSLDIKIDFEGKIEVTKSSTVRELYSLLIKLLEIWNSYEALKHYTIEIGVASRSESIYKMYSQKFLKDFGCLQILRETLDQLKDKYKNSHTFSGDFRTYISRIDSNSEISTNLKNSCKSILEYFEGTKIISGIEIIALIYSERNMYYHNGETVIYGMYHNNRKILLTELIDCFIEYILWLIIKILKEKIYNINGH